MTIIDNHNKNHNINHIEQTDNDDYPDNSGGDHEVLVAVIFEMPLIINRSVTIKTSITKQEEDQQ